MSVPFYGQPWDGEQIPEQWGCYFAGLVDGEGCFYIGPKVCSFTIKLRDDDRALIERLHSLFRIGTITTEKSSRVADRNRKPRPIQDTAEDVSAEGVRPQPVGRAGRGEACDDVLTEGAVGGDRGSHEGQDPPGQDHPQRSQRQRRSDERTRQEPCQLRAPPGARQRRSGHRHRR